MIETAERGFWGKTMLLVRKDLRVEARGRETLLPMLLFAVAVLLLLAFTIPTTSGRAVGADPARGIAPAEVLAGFLWVTILFAGLIGFARTFEVEREDDALDALLLVPLDRSALFASKALANLAFITLIEIVLVPLFVLLFDLRPPWGAFVGVIALVDVGFVAVGTLFASIAAQTRSRELVLPILSLPALVPLFVAAVELSSDLFMGKDIATVAGRGWFGILVASDIAFVVAGTLGTDLVLE